jgi:hypothetical protein
METQIAFMKVMKTEFILYFFVEQPLLKIFEYLEVFGYFDNVFVGLDENAILSVGVIYGVQ